MNPAVAPLAALRARFPADRQGFLIFADSDCALHDPHTYIPDTPGRLAAALRGIGSLPADTPLAVRGAPPATWGALKTVHEPGYLLALESAIHSGKPHFMHPECPLDFGSGDAILAAAGLATALGDSLAEGASGFALTRPPGHHAGPARAEGFSFINHAALAAARIRARHPGARIAVIDLDVHHGNGTQDCLGETPGTFFLSVHGDPSALMYPKGGFAAENRDAPAIIRNMPLPEGSDGPVWLAALAAGLAEIEPFRPGFVLLSLGLDGHAEDPFRFFRLTDDDHTSALDEILRRFPGTPLGILLEGGYSEAVLERLTPRLVARCASARSHKASR